MKKSIPILVLALILVIIIDFSLLYKIESDKKKYWKIEDSTRYFSDSLLQESTFRKVWELTIPLIYEFQSSKIDQNIFFLDEEEKKIPLSQIDLRTPKLVFKYSSLNCNTCVDEQIRLFKEISKKIGSENTLIITDYNTPRELTQFLRMNQIDNQILNLRSAKLTEIDNSLPYFFVLDTTYCLKELFVPLRDFPNSTLIYLNQIMKKYFPRNQ